MNREKAWVFAFGSLTVAVILFTLWLYPRIGIDQTVVSGAPGVPAPLIIPHPSSLRAPSRISDRKIRDSVMDLSGALGRNSFPKEILDQLVLIDVDYNGFDGHIHQGQLVVNRDVAGDVTDVFKEILPTGEQIEKAVPIVAYDWSDDASIRDNNTSAFNYRKKIGPGVGHSLSRHSFGRAIDVNPYQNPFVAADGKTDRPYRPGTLGTIDGDSPITRAFKKRGWTWGGDWAGGKDYQHFDKTDPRQP